VRKNTISGVNDKTLSRKGGKIKNPPGVFPGGFFYSVLILISTRF
jgi:hypothetical protein